MPDLAEALARIETRRAEYERLVAEVDGPAPYGEGVADGLTLALGILREQ